MISLISTKGRYALRVMIDLTENADKCIPLKEIAERQQISKKYLEIIVKKLVSGNMIVGSSGKGGGYKLCRKPEEYTVGEILEITEGSFFAVACLSPDVQKCPRASKCKTLPLWSELNGIVRDFLFSKKLSDLL